MAGAAARESSQKTRLHGAAEQGQPASVAAAERGARLAHRVPGHECPQLFPGSIVQGTMVFGEYKSTSNSARGQQQLALDVERVGS